MSSYLVDVNVWLAISHKDHIHHEVAFRWFQGSDGLCCFCRSTQLGLLRLLTNERVMGASAQTQTQAWKTYDILEERLDVEFIREPASTQRVFRELSMGGHKSPNAWNDAYLGALSIVAAMTIVTFDSVFRTMPGVDAIILTQRR